MNPTILFKLVLLCLFACLGASNGAFAQSRSGSELDLSKCWEYVGAVSASLLAVDNEHIYIGSKEGRVEAISVDGKKIWESEFGGTVNSNLLPLNGGLMVVTSNVSTDPSKQVSSKLRLLSKETGIMNWGITLSGGSAYYLGTFGPSAIIVSYDGLIRSVDVKTGEIKWQRQVGAKVVAAPSFSGTTLTVATDARKLITYAATNGVIEHERSSRFRTTAILETDDGQIIAGDERGNITFLNGGSKEWQFKSGGEISGIFAVDSNILAASHDNFIYLLAGSNGSIVWKRRVTGRLAQIGRIGPRNALLAGPDDHNAVFIDLANGKTASQLAFADDERIVYQPIESSDRIYVLTNRSLYAYSRSHCSLKAQKAAPL